MLPKPVIWHRLAQAEALHVTGIGMREATAQPSGATRPSTIS